MRILFAGSPDIAIPTLEILYRTGNLIGVLTNPDRPQGRGKRLQGTPVKERALELGVPVYTFESLKKEARECIQELKPTLLVSFAYSRIFGPKFLSIFPQGGINVHPSLLPRFRGPSPLTEAILQGDTHTGITIQTLALGMDEGDILLQKQIPLDGTETTESLSLWAAQEGATMVSETLEKFDTLPKTPQSDDSATYCTKIAKSDGAINWSEPACEIDRKIRAYTPWPRCFTFLQGQRVVIHSASVGANNTHNTPGAIIGSEMANVKGINTLGIRVATGSGELLVTHLQRAGKKVVTAEDFLRGTQGDLGTFSCSDI